MPPKVGQRAQPKDMPHRPTQPSVAQTPSSSTGPASGRPAKAGPPKAAANLENPNASQKAANPVRATIHDLNDRDD